MRGNWINGFMTTLVGTDAKKYHGSWICHCMDGSRGNMLGSFGVGWIPLFGGRGGRLCRCGWWACVSTLEGGGGGYRARVYIPVCKIELSENYPHRGEGGGW